MSDSAVRDLIERTSKLTDDERWVAVNGIAPKELTASLAEEWEKEIARRAARVRSGESSGKPADEVFARLERKLRDRDPLGA